jgi:hypothetical protein
MSTLYGKDSRGQACLPAGRGSRVCKEKRPGISRRMKRQKKIGRIEKWC